MIETANMYAVPCGVIYRNLKKVQTKSRKKTVFLAYGFKIRGFAAHPESVNSEAPFFSVYASADRTAESGKLP